MGEAVIYRCLLITCLVIPCSLGHAEDALSPVTLLELRESAEAAYAEQDAARAIEHIEDLIRAYPHDPELWFGLSRAYEWTNDFGPAIAAAERAEELGFVNKSYTTYRLAQLNARAGNHDDALHWIRAALAARYEDRPDIQHDPAFSALVETPEFRQLAGMLPERTLSRDEGLRFDLDYLAAEAKRMHAGPARPAHSAEFDAAVRQLHDDLPSMSDLEVLGGFMTLLAYLDDGHTAIYGPGEGSPLDISPKVLPLKFYAFKEGVFIADAVGEWQHLAGMQVTKIGDYAVDELLQKMSDYRGVDNAMTWRWMGPQFYLPRFSMLQLVGALHSPDYATVTVLNAQGVEQKLRIPRGSEQPPRKLRPSSAATGSVPLYLSDIDTAYWMKRLPSRDAMYLQFNQVRDTEAQTIAEFAAELAEALRADDIETLVIDVRHNNGGNNTLLKPLLKTLVWFEQNAPGNRIFVIAGRNTFSAAQNFLNRVEQQTDAVVVGEPSGSSPNFVGEETGLLLPYSRVRGSISTRYWQDSSPGDDRPWIVPALIVEPTAEDYFAGRDAALEAILDLLGPET